MTRIEELNLPDVLDGVNSLNGWGTKKEQIKEMLQKIEYGYMPAKPDGISFEETVDNDKALAGKATITSVKINVTVNGKSKSFPARLVKPNSGEKIKTVVMLNFSPDIPSNYLPAEELIDRGIAVMLLYYKDVTSDDNDFTTGIAPLFACENRPGKLVIWAWAASRCADYILSKGFTDPDFLGVAGHSRLGKTALVCGAFDERFKFVYSNDSGCGGAAIYRQKQGEDIYKITEVFPFWFQKDFKDYSYRENELPFDQHFLFSLIAPRKIYIASAALDSWAAPENEYLCCKAATPVYKLFGIDGLIEEDFTDNEQFTCHGGNIGYHRRYGTHYFSRYDWNKFIDFMEKYAE